VALSEELLAILACPGCKGPLTICRTSPALICAACRLRYPVRDGIPVLLLDEAEPANEE
jgi:uncharacterized protein YbaR (Trm112 family)